MYADKQMQAAPYANQSRPALDVSTGRESEINRQLLWNREETGTLESLIDSLAGRLQSIVAPPSPANLNGVQSIPPAVTPFGEEFSRNTSRLVVVNDRVRDLLNRLEV